jgi:tetratricopeptide (TPR) repeat protein
MRRDEHKRQRRLLKRRRDRARARRRGIEQPYSQWSADERLRNARHLPLGDCLIDRSWREHGRPLIVITRREPDGGIALGSYEVDMWCVGLRDTTCGVGLPERAYLSELRKDLLGEDDMVECPEDLAYTIIHGAVEFAGRFGFRPHAGFRRSRHLLPPKGSFVARQDVEFGRDGKPFYVPDPEDDVDNILERLAALGDGNYGTALDGSRGGPPVELVHEVGRRPAWARLGARIAGAGDDERLARRCVGRLRELPARAGETWQGGLFHLPGCVQEEGRAPYRMTAAFWADAGTGVAHMGKACGPGEEHDGMVLDALTQFASDASLTGYRPGRLEVNTQELAERLDSVVAELGIEVRQRSDLGAVRRLLRCMASAIGEDDDVPGALSGRGVTEDRLRAFAEAACGFYQARPWRLLDVQDLVCIEEPRPPRHMRYVTVLGRGAEAFGLGFYPSVRAYWDLQEAEDLDEAIARGGETWFVMYGDIMELPVRDAGLWEELGLPTAGAEGYAYAGAWRRRGRAKRPDARRLAFLEGLLRALAESTEDDLDAGRWSRHVETSDGPVAYTLSLPFMLEPPDRQEISGHGFALDRRGMERPTEQLHRFAEERGFLDLDELNEALDRQFSGKPFDETVCPPRTNAERAQDLCYQAFGAWGRRRLVLARQALAIWPDCADAYVILGERSDKPEEALVHYAKGMEAGRRALGEETFRVEAGHFWGVTRTRPFMRAALGTAQCLERLGKESGAIERYRELLALNPRDNQAVRYFLLPLLVRTGRTGEARRLLDEYGGDSQATWHYCRALLAFAVDGDTPPSRRLLGTAVRANGHVPDLLLRNRAWPAWPPVYAHGSEEEAVVCCDACAPAWESVPGALEWLADRVQDGEAA